MKSVRRFPKILGKILIALGFLIIASVIAFDYCVKPSLMKLLDYKCRNEAERIISEAVFSRLSGEQESCSDLISFTFDENGRITSLQTNQSRINSLKAMLNESVNSGISEMKEEKVGISIGTLTGLSFLYGRGFDFEFNVEPRGKAETRLLSSFQSSGINQTLHSITLQVNATLSPMLSGFDENIEIETDYIIAQTVIVGEVPNQFSNIILGEEYYSELANISL